MSKYNWCHNPDCHTIETQSRIRGTGDNKVLRTIKIKVGRYNYSGRTELADIWDYFCNQHCLFSFLRKFAQEISNIAPVREPKETPIKVRTEKYESYRYDWNGQGESRRVPYQATRKIIEKSS
tara:strand:+ start:123 stop:491 length:369 start_codon:yes stop_codon:yes gene_type:complete